MQVVSKLYLLLYYYVRKCVEICSSPESQPEEFEQCWAKQKAVNDSYCNSTK